MQTKTILCFVGASLLVAACRNEDAPLFTITPHPLPAEKGEAVQLSGDETGKVYASWIEPGDSGTYAFRYARFEDNGWSEPTLIARGDQGWFVNWADMPRLAPYRGDPLSMAAFWLQRSSRQPYDHHILISQTRDGGQTWQAPVMPYEVRIPAFYGLCKLLPLPNGRMLVAWQDGRETVIELPHGGRTVPNFNGHLSLQTVEIDPDGQLYETAQVDDMISELCPFDVALTDAGPVIAYRDVEPGKIKDIAITRSVNGVWTTPQKLFPDRWEVSYFTLDGPAIDADGNRVAVAWYSSPNDVPQVKLALSNNAGETFSQPIRIDNGQPVGKVDVAFISKDRIVVSWVEKEETGSYLMTALVTARGRILGKQEISPVDEAKPAGFPVLARTTNGALLAWKETSEAFGGLRAVYLAER